jgi:hypothetical protein
MRYLVLALFFAIPQFADIPKKFHFVWVGPKNLEDQDSKNIENFAKKHPDFQIILWTDQKREKLSKKIIQKIISDSSFSSLAEEYKKSKNFGEKAHLLKLEILLKEGGVYLEPDMQSHYKMHDLLKESFFVGLSADEVPIIGYKGYISKAILGCEPFHPILKKVIEETKKDFSKIGQLYPNQDEESKIYRMNYRILKPLDQVVRNYLLSNPEQGKVFPIHYFHDYQGKKGIYANHLSLGRWYKEESPFDYFLRNQLIRMQKKVMKIEIALVAFLLIFISVQIVSFRKKWAKKKEKLLH